MTSTIYATHPRYAEHDYPGHPELICIMMTAHADTPTAIGALRNGAYDYVDKSSDPTELLVVLERVALVDEPEPCGR